MGPPPYKLLTLRKMQSFRGRDTGDERQMEKGRGREGRRRREKGEGSGRM